MNKIIIPTNKGMTVIMYENIIRIEANSNYCRVFFDNARPLTVAKLLHWFEGRLSDEYFYRIHRTHIVNRMFITGISEDNKLTLVNGEKIK